VVAAHITPGSLIKFTLDQATKSQKGIKGIALPFL
jgi:hypothetical protein